MRHEQTSLVEPIYAAGIASQKAIAYIIASVAMCIGCLLMAPLLISYDLDAVGWFALIVGPIAGVGGLLRSTVYRVMFFEDGFVHRNSLGISREYVYGEIREMLEGDGYITLHMRDAKRTKLYGIEGDPEEIKPIMLRHGVTVA